MKLKQIICLFLILGGLLSPQVLAVDALSDGAYWVEVTLTGGSGKASIESPASVEIVDGVPSARLVWSSPNYTWMAWNGTRYDRISGEETSTFVLPIVLDAPMDITAETLAMSEAHTVAYQLRFDAQSLKPQKNNHTLLVWLAVISVVGFGLGLYLGKGRKRGGK